MLWKMIIGVVSDTHGVVKPALLKALKGVQHIIHAGDIGGPEVLESLSQIASVTAVRGNMDNGSWTQNLPFTDMVQFEGRLFYVLHNLAALDLEPSVAGVATVISGHTHQPEIKKDRGILYLNPGSASFGRHGEPPSMGCIELTVHGLHPQIIHL